ncbi:hypothetical protein BH10PSE19_BH10PSE19_20670 [soil metagenome]
MALDPETIARLTYHIKKYEDNARALQKHAVAFNIKVPRSVRTDSHMDELKPVSQLPIYLGRGHEPRSYHFSDWYKILIKKKIHTTIANGKAGFHGPKPKKYYTADFSNYMGVPKAAMPEETAWTGEVRKTLQRDKNDYTLRNLTATSMHTVIDARPRHYRYSLHRSALYKLKIDYKGNDEFIFDKKSNSYVEISNDSEVKQHSLKTLNLPILDNMPACLSTPEVNQVHNLLLETLIANKGMLIHCAAGIGRTGNLWLPMLILMQFAYPQLAAANFPKLKSVYTNDFSPAELIMNALAISREFRPGLVASDKQLKDCYALASHMLRAHAAMLRQKLHDSEQKEVILDEKQYRQDIAFLKPAPAEARQAVIPQLQIMKLINLLRKLHTDKASLSYPIWLLLKEDVRFFVDKTLRSAVMKPISDTDKAFLKQVQEAITLTEMLGAPLVYDPVAAALKDDEGNYLRDNVMQLLGGNQIPQYPILPTPQSPSCDPPPSLLLRLPSWPGKRWLDQHISASVPKYFLAIVGFLLSFLPLMLNKTYQQLRSYPVWTIGLTVILAAIFIGCPLLLPTVGFPTLVGLLAKSVVSWLAYSTVSLGCLFTGALISSAAMLCRAFRWREWCQSAKWPPPAQIEMHSLDIFDDEHFSTDADEAKDSKEQEWLGARNVVLPAATFLPFYSSSSSDHSSLLTSPSVCLPVGTTPPAFQS